MVGLFRMIAAIRLKFPHWGWAVFDGIVSLGLEILLWADWPVVWIAIRNLPVRVEVSQAA